MQCVLLRSLILVKFSTVFEVILSGCLKWILHLPCDACSFPYWTHWKCCGIGLFGIGVLNLMQVVWRRWFLDWQRFFWASSPRRVALAELPACGVDVLASWFFTLIDDAELDLVGCVPVLLIHLMTLLSFGIGVWRLGPGRNIESLRRSKASVIDAASTATCILITAHIFARIAIEIKLDLELQCLLFMFLYIFRYLLLNSTYCRILVQRFIFGIRSIVIRSEGPCRFNVVKVIASHVTSGGVTPDTAWLTMAKLGIPPGYHGFFTLLFGRLVFIDGFEDEF